MNSRLAQQSTSPWSRAPLLRDAFQDPAPYDTGNSASRQPSTGTVDDDDEPEDEHDGENEAAERETRDTEEAPEEFLRDDEDSRGA